MRGIPGTNKTFTISFSLEFVKRVGADVEQIQYPFAIVEMKISDRFLILWLNLFVWFYKPIDMPHIKRLLVVNH